MEEIRPSDDIKYFDHGNLTKEQEKLIDKLIELNTNYKLIGFCKECGQPNTDFYWCQSCIANHFQQNFKHWTSGNHDIDELIQKVQLKAELRNQIIEWIEFERFKEVKYLTKGGFGTTYKAIWKDGCIRNWDSEDNQWKRFNGDLPVALKCLHNSRDFTVEFLREIESHINMSNSKYVVRYYGLTKEPETNDFMMVMEYAINGSLRQNLNNSFNSLNWNDKLKVLCKLANSLNDIHDKGLIHKDFGSGIILTDVKKLGLCQPETANPSQSGVYGVLPYLAPEILRGSKYTQASDIYSFGIVMFEFINELPPYHDIEHDSILAVKICNGLRPRFNINVPQLIEDIALHCVDADPLKRPGARELNDLFLNLCNDAKDENSLISKQIKESVEINNQLFSTKSKNLSDNNNATKWIKDALENEKVKLISFDQLKNPEPLDKGGFGYIMKAIWTKTNRDVIYKKLINTTAIKHNILDAFINELTIHLRLDYSDRIVRCLGISQDQLTNEYLLVMQYANYGDLQNYLKNNFEKLTWNDKKKLAFQIAEGLHYLHNEDILHRDLHSKNIVIHNGDAKITDFGISKIRNNNNSTIHVGNFGCIAYMEPKRILDPKFPYTESSDIYSFGVLMWEISSGYPPFKDIIRNSEMTALAIAINAGTRETTIPGTPKEYEELYNNCWEAGPIDRPNISKILNEFAKMGFGNDAKNIIIEENAKNNNVTTHPDNNESECLGSDSTLINFDNL